MDEMDLTASETKATYQQIKDYIFEKHNVKVSSLYIAQVKQKYGIGNLFQQTDNHMRLYQKPCAGVNSGFEDFLEKSRNFGIHFTM